jgi:hypothetical protein
MRVLLPELTFRVTVVSVASGAGRRLAPVVADRYSRARQKVA